MKTIHLYIALLLIATTTICADCYKHQNFPSSPQYSFMQSADILPYRLDYSVGDTVWVHVNIPGKELYDTLTKSTIMYDSASITASLSAQLFYNNPFIANNTNLVSFIYTPDVSAYESNNQNITSSLISFGCNQPSGYDLLVGIVFLQKGVFGINLGGNIQKCNPNYNTYILFNFYFNVPDSHLDYYNQLPFADISQLPQLYIQRQLGAKSTVCVNVQ